MGKDDNRFYSRKEAQARFEAALRGARVAGHKAMSELHVGKRKASRAADAGRKKRRSQKKKPAK